MSDGWNIPTSTFLHHKKTKQSFSIVGFFLLFQKMVLRFAFLLFLVAEATFNKPDLSEYGMDVSYPIHHYIDGNGSKYSLF